MPKYVIKRRGHDEWIIHQQGARLDHWTRARCEAAEYPTRELAERMAYVERVDQHCEIISTDDEYGKRCPQCENDRPDLCPYCDGRGHVTPPHFEEWHRQNQPTETLCKHCDHFIEPNFDYAPDNGLCEYIHMEDGEQEFDHDAEPGETRTTAQWGELRPDLTQMHPDGKIGPNSRFHSR